MGRGFLEAVYQECLEIEFASEDSVRSQHRLPIMYKGRTLDAVLQGRLRLLR